MNDLLKNAVERKNQRDVVRYINANGFLQELKKYSRLLKRQELTTLRCQALGGDIDGARKGLAKLLERR